MDFSKTSVSIAPFPVGDKTFDPVMNDLYYSSLREFFVLDCPQKQVIDNNGDSFFYSNTSFFGIPADEAARPGDYIFTYDGRINYFFAHYESGYDDSINYDYAEQHSGAMTLIMNWRNSKFMLGFKKDGDENFRLIGFGNIASDAPDLDKAVFFGTTLTDHPDLQKFSSTDTQTSNVSDVLWRTSDTNIASTQFFGSKYQGVGGVFQGDLLDVASNMSQSVGMWALSFGGFKSGNTITAPTGKVVLNGFVTGVGEDMNQPDQNRRVFLNKKDSDFSITLDRDAGTVTGSFSAADFHDSSINLENVKIGDAGNSAYITDDMFAALISGNGVVNSGTTAGDIKPKGAYIETDSYGGKLADYVSWGYWETPYNDPQTGAPYHIHVPGSMWVAGEKTPNSDLLSLISQKVTGNYLGPAKGVMTQNNVAGITQMDGSSEININFASSSSDAVSGKISFPSQNIVLNLEKGSIIFKLGVNGLNVNGFKAKIANTIASDLNGGFFGNNAKSIGGNFHADLNDNKTEITGIFAGDRP